MDTFDLLIYDATNMFSSGNFNWFNTLAYDPFHLTGDLSVVYSYCGGFQQLDQITSMFSKDWSALSQMGSTMVTYAITNLPDMMAQF